jgi:ABC-type dipeptide/oligopeptide/nickel transport system permease subunit
MASRLETRPPKREEQPPTPAEPAALDYARLRTARRLRLRPDAWIAFAMVLATAAGVLAGPLLWRADPEALDLTNKYAGFSGAAPLGTDDFGRDILSRLLHGGRLTFAGAVLVLVGCSGIGLVMGCLAGFSGGRWDSLISRLIDAFLSLPSLVVALGIVGVMGKSFTNLVIALVLTGWPWYARIYRSLVIRERNQPYVLAALSLGATRFRVLWRHIGPNILGPALVVATVNLGNAMLSLASLSFLGLGVRPPTPEWGAMVSDARFHFQTHPWLIAAPGLAIALSVLGVNILGDALREMTDPRPRQRFSILSRRKRP